MRNKETLAKLLTYSGAIPFAATLLLAALKPATLNLDYTAIAIGYGAVIASFIAGIHWGIFLFKETPLNLFIHSNIAALLAWLALLVPTQAGLAVLAGCLLYLLTIDSRLQLTGILPAWYMRLRLRISCLVIGILLAHSALLL